MYFWAVLKFKKTLANNKIKKIIQISTLFPKIVWATCVGAHEPNIVAIFRDSVSGKAAYKYKSDYVTTIQ